MTDTPESTADEKAARSVRRGSTLVLFLILATFSWYLLADRYTPYTQQARVQGFVVGVAPKVSGVITEMWVRNDQQVQAGERLFQIDRSSYEIALAQARANLAEARAKLAAASAAVEAARSRLTSALANEEKERATLKEAVARVAGARADLQKAKENERSAREKLSAAKSAVDKAELDLENTLVTAETDGVITDLQAEVGRYAAQGQAVMTLVAIQSVWIQVQFTENNLGHLEPGTPVEFTLDAQPGRVFQGRVVIAYTSEARLLRILGKAFIRFMSWISYVY